MRRLPSLGLIPLYLALYDEVAPDLRHSFQPFLDDLAARFKAAGIRLHMAPICCVDSDIRAAVSSLEAKGVEALATLHLAYSPSEEALPALCASKLPLLLLDTTMDAAFGCDVAPEQIMRNHGIHGVQDLASVLRRHRRPCHIIAGHPDLHKPVERAADVLRGIHAATSMRDTRALRIGHPFRGMGDFAVPPEDLASHFGIISESYDPDHLRDFAAQVTQVEIESELRSDRHLYAVEAPEAVHRRSIRVGLALRRCLSEHDAAAFSINFQAFTSDQPPIDTVPFLEASKSMARGIGYAGEGDLLTASFVGGLVRAFPRVTFTEIFCPDWQGNSLFLSHMGEINPQVVDGKALLLEKDYPFSPAANPAFFAGAPAPGPATLANLAPGPDTTFSLILAPVEVLPDTSGPDLRATIRGWIRPTLPLPAFLERYSQLGGTHHSALLLGNHLEALQAMARALHIDCQVIDQT